MPPDSFLSDVIHAYLGSSLVRLMSASQRTLAPGDRSGGDHEIFQLKVYISQSEIVPTGARTK
jgi:hypothetical protein